MKFTAAPSRTENNGSEGESIALPACLEAREEGQALQGGPRKRGKNTFSLSQRGIICTSYLHGNHQQLLLPPLPEVLEKAAGAPALISPLFPQPWRTQTKPPCVAAAQ